MFYVQVKMNYLPSLTIFKHAEHLKKQLFLLLLLPFFDTSVKYH